MRKNIIKIVQLRLYNNCYTDIELIVLQPGVPTKRYVDWQLNYYWCLPQHLEMLRGIYSNILLVLHFLIYPNFWVPLEKWLIRHLEQKMKRLSLRHLVTPENKISKVTRAVSQWLKSQFPLAKIGIFWGKRKEGKKEY